MKAFWQKKIRDLLLELETSKQGLTSAEAANRLATYGPNTLSSKRQDAAWKIFLAQFKDPITIILIFSAVLSIFMNDLTDGLIILAIILVSSLLSFRQEYRAGNAVQGLLKTVSVTSSVLRDGQLLDLPTAELTVGDVLVFNAGDMIPADCRILTVHELTVDESTLTGETFPIEKSVSAVELDTPLAKRTDVLWMGTHVISGTGTAVLVHTAPHTQFGRITKSLNQHEQPTDFERGTRQFGLLILRVTAVMIGFIFLFNILLHKPFLESFMFALALSVGLTPQMLPAIVSINLSEGANRMSKKDVIVKKLTSIENFGAMTVMCSDKTGTITEGKVALAGHTDTGGKDSDMVAYLAALNAGLQEGYTNAIDEAILADSKLSLDEVKKLDEIPYSFESKSLSVLLDVSADAHFTENRLLVTKGALEPIIECCTQVRMGNGNTELIASHLDYLHQLYEQYSRQGYRVLGLAIKSMTETSPLVADQLTFVGFLLFTDPIKQDLPATVSRMKELGVKLKMITGDNELIAQQVGTQIGLNPKFVMTGEQVNRYSPSQLAKRVKHIEIFAEIDPNEKEKIIVALKDAGEIVGYMGDGINDAPAIKRADVGISVDTAADTAKDAAAIVLLKNDLNVLIEGIQEGRKTFVNTLKYIFISTSANFGNMFSMAGASLFLNFLPLLPKQILLTNFLTDFPSLQIANDTVDEEWLTAPIVWNMAFIRRFMVVFGLISSAFDYLTFLILLLVFHANETLFQSGWLFESILTEVLVMLIVRTARPFLRSHASRGLLWTTGVAVLIELVLLYTPVNRLLGVTALPIHMVLGLLAISVFYTLVVESVKHWFYTKHSFLKKS